MKKLTLSILALGALVLGSAKFAAADNISGEISIAGVDTYTAGPPSVITFVPPSFVFAPTTTGDFSVFDSSATVNMASTFSYSPFVSETLFTITEGVNTATFVIDSLSSVSTAGGTGLVINGAGMLSLTGFSDTMVSFFLSTTGPENTNVTFDATALSVTPEPSSLFLLGTGLLACGALLYRRRQQGLQEMV